MRIPSPAQSVASAVAASDDPLVLADVEEGGGHLYNFVTPLFYLLLDLDQFGLTDVNVPADRCRASWAQDHSGLSDHALGAKRADYGIRVSDRI